jgi:ABC-type antimicrobial peptide transport system permease subunit
MGIIMDKRFDSNTLSLYFFLPLMWIMFFGILPAIIVGFIFGYQVKSKDFVSVK